MNLPEILERLHDLDRRVARIERLCDPPRSGLSSADKIVLDKEHDRVMREMSDIRHSYDAHQSWSKQDLQRFVGLRVRRDELRKLLGIKH